MVGGTLEKLRAPRMVQIGALIQMEPSREKHQEKQLPGEGRADALRQGHPSEVIHHHDSRMELRRGQGQTEGAL